MCEENCFYCKRETTKVVQQTILLQNATGAGLLACFPFCWGQFQLHRGTFSTHLACLGAGICADVMGVSLCEKHCVKACFLRPRKRDKMLQIN